MRVNTKSGWFKLSAVLVSVAFIYVSCNFRPIFLKPKFTVWQPKQLEYTGELVEKWSFDFKTDVCGYVRKNSWVISTGYSVFEVSEKGLKKDVLKSFYGIDDANSSARIEYYNGTMSYYDNSWNLIPYWFRFGASEMLVARDDYIVMLRGDDHVQKVDINSGALLWEYVFPEKNGFLKPTFCVAGDKVALNAYFRNVDDTTLSEDDADKVVLLDIESGQDKVIDIPGNTECTQFNNELYLIIDEKKVSRFDTQKMELVGETIALDKNFKDGHYMRSPLFNWFGASNLECQANALINPITMKLEYKNINIETSMGYLYSQYLICFAHYDDHITGINTETFKETWSISTKNFKRGFKVILGDERGILIQSDGKLICFGPP